LRGRGENFLGYAWKKEKSMKGSKRSGIAQKKDLTLPKFNQRGEGMRFARERKGIFLTHKGAWR